MVLTCREEISVPLDLPGALISEIKHLASMHNPKFYLYQYMRRSTFRVPRMIGRFRVDDKLYVPRGLLDKVVRELKRAGAKVKVSLSRPRKKVGIEFVGELRDEQKQAVKAMLEHDTGILVAPPGAGKTVMACAIINARKVRTCVLVERVELARQWRKRIDEFLGDAGDAVEVITMQKAAHRAVDPDMLAPYDFIVVDECHNAGAPSREARLQRVKARYWLGLTATPERLDGVGELVTLQLGPIRYRMESRQDEVGKKTLCVHQTDFRSDSTDLVDLQGELAADRKRNQLIADNIAEAFGEGRSVLVLVNRLEALRELRRRLRPIVGPMLLSMHGGQTAEQRDVVREVVTSGEPVVIIATDKTAGEGIDLPALNTLFLAAPFSWKGLAVQYTGRITRGPGETDEAGDFEPTVHDYVDAAVPALQAMACKRHRAMKDIGWTCSSARDDGDFHQEGFLEL